MKVLANYTIDNRMARIADTDLANWWVLQQLFAYPPFDEFFDTDKLIEYYSEFSDGGIYQLELNVSKDIWLPVGLLSWHPMCSQVHPVNFGENERVAYISDSITYKAYQNKGVQSILFDYTLNEMKRQNYTIAYLRTNPQSNMCFLAKKMGFEQIPDISQKVSSMRVGSVLKTDERIFFRRCLRE